MVPSVLENEDPYTMSNFDMSNDRNNLLGGGNESAEYTVELTYQNYKSNKYTEHTLSKFIVKREADPRVAYPKIHPHPLVLENPSVKNIKYRGSSW